MPKYTPKYWNHKGRFQGRYDKMRKDLVPQSGDADTVIGQMIRFIGNIYYDIYNNGGCNLKDTSVFKQARVFLIDHVGVFRETAEKFKVDNFPAKLSRFTRGQVDAREADEVVDVIVDYCYRNQKANTCSK